MEKTGVSISIMEKVALSCDAFTTGFSCLLVLFFIPYAAEYSYVAVLCVLPLACLVPFAVMPVLYSVIHRADTLLFGRYHLVMPVSAFLSAVFFVFIFCARSVSAGGACFIVIGAVLFAVTAPLYRYCAFSVRARLRGENIISGSRTTAGFSAFGGAAAVGVFAGFYYYDASTAYINTAYVLGAATVLLALFQYLATYYGIPRLSGKRVQSVGSVFRNLFDGIDGRVFACVLLFDAAFFAAAALTVYSCIVGGAGMYSGMISAAALVVAYCVTALVIGRFFPSKRTRLFIPAFVFLLSGAAACAVAVVVPLDTVFATVMTAAGAALVGAGGCAAMRQTKVRLISVKPDITSGIAFLLVELIMTAALAIALAAGAAVVVAFKYTASTYAVFGGFCAAAVAAIAAVSVAAHGRYGNYRPLRVTYEQYAAITEDRVERASDVNDESSRAADE